LQDPSLLAPQTKPLKPNTLDPKLSCSLQDSGYGLADPAVAVVADYAGRFPDASAGIAWNIPDALRATFSGCREQSRRTPNPSPVFAGDIPFFATADIPVCCRHFALDSSWKVRRSAGSNDNDGSATFAIPDLLGVPLRQNSEQSKTAAQNIETFIEYLPRLRR
jgi:hypothetical protein